MENPIVQALTQRLVEVAEPQKIFIVSRKTNNTGKLSSIKLALIVGEVESIGELESKIYMEVDCRIPYNLVLYRRGKWDELIEDEQSFAHRIDETGVLIYEQK